MNDSYKALRYFFDRTFRAGVMWIMNRITARAREEEVDFRAEDIKRILLVRGLFRMGDAILATPAISLMQHNFPTATIDFVGPNITKKLFENLPINHYYEIHRNFPKVCWSYLALLNRLRRTKYDLALDASGSSAALGSFIVGFSGARFRVGVRGRWDRWFNVRVARPLSINKYANLPDLITSLGIDSPRLLPALVLSEVELAEGRKQLAALIPDRELPIVAIFIGGRKSRGKRWPSTNFVELAMLLGAQGARPIVFVGPEELESLVYLQSVLAHRVPVFFEPRIKRFASLVANCHLFVACDSGPVHLACALRVRTVTIFLKNDFDRWGPPPSLGRVVYRESGIAVAEVLQACQAELAAVRGKSESQNIANG
ncbi:MAG: glycosyltransferase family 9 protein [Candidatus Binatia bacterium]